MSFTSETKAVAPPGIHERIARGDRLGESRHAQVGLLGENGPLGDEAGKDETDPSRAPRSGEDEHLVAGKGVV